MPNESGEERRGLLYLPQATVRISKKSNPRLAIDYRPQIHVGTAAIIDQSFSQGGIWSDTACQESDRIAYQRLRISAMEQWRED